MRTFLGGTHGIDTTIVKETVTVERLAEDMELKLPETERPAPPSG